MSEEEVKELIEGTGIIKDPTLIRITSLRLKGKLDKYNDEYFKWYEILIIIGFTITAYYFPVWLLYFQRKLLNMEKEDEVMSFQTLIIMLMHFERISVENIIEWLYNFSTIFRDPIIKTLNDYDMGIEEALEDLKEATAFQPFTKLIDDLQAADKTSILQAFDELETEREFFSKT